VEDQTRSLSLLQHLLVVVDDEVEAVDEDDHLLAILLLLPAPCLKWFAAEESMYVNHESLVLIVSEDHI
jgi:hypothetical protein